MVAEVRSPDGSTLFAVVVLAVTSYVQSSFCLDVTSYRVPDAAEHGGGTATGLPSWSVHAPGDP